MFLQASVILLTGGGVCLSACWDTPPGSRHPPEQTPPWEQTPPGADIPWEQTAPQIRHTPPEQTPPGADTPPLRSRHPTLQEQTPPPRKQTPAYSQWAAGTHPTGMYSCFRSVCQEFCSQGRGVVSQHALQVSRPTPRGELEGSGQGGLQVHTQGGILACTEADPSPPTADSYCCGQYATYWNAFLFVEKYYNPSILLISSEWLLK